MAQITGNKKVDSAIKTVAKCTLTVGAAVGTIWLLREAMKYSYGLGLEDGYACAKEGGKIIASAIDAGSSVAQSALDLTNG